ncbi:Putative niacin/nicotinamide transporter NaiP [Sphingobacterium daejeonense]|nr:Putative niacin/nicotinamide transporter NaiP [Sphingobacterium daejeonense]
MGIDFVAALGYFVDIYDLIIFSIVRIQSFTDIGVPADQMRSKGEFVLNMQMGGLLIGGVIWGVLGDKYGRLKVLFGSILLYSIANIANGFVHDVTTYGIIRFIAGIGLAGELGAGITLVSESMHRKKRGYGTMDRGWSRSLRSYFGVFYFRMVQLENCLFCWGRNGNFIIVYAGRGIGVRYVFLFRK